MSRKLTALLMALLAGTGPAAMARESAQGPREGIVVHGNWVLEVRNPDGTLAERRAFENGLASGGDQGADLLAQFLGRQRAIGPWAVYLINPTGTAPWSRPPYGIVKESNGLPSQPGFSRDLTLARSLGAIILTGSITATVDGAITDVATEIDTCPGAVTMLSCPDTKQGRLTYTPVKNSSGVPTPLALLAGQIVQVKVTISFTSPAGS